MGIPSTSEPLVALVVDDHAAARQGIATAIAMHGVSVVGQCSTASEVRHVLSGLAAGSNVVILIDMRLGAESGLELALSLPAHQRKRAIIVTMHDSAAEAATCLRKGVGGYVSKKTDPGTLVEHMRTVADGQTALEEKYRPVIWQFMQDQPGQDLTLRELEILKAIRDGHSANRAISLRMFVSEKTVESHLSTLYSKFGVRNKSALLMKVIHLNLLDPP